MGAHVLSSSLPPASALHHPTPCPGLGEVGSLCSNPQRSSLPALVINRQLLLGHRPVIPTPHTLSSGKTEAGGGGWRGVCRDRMKSRPAS